MALLLLLFNTLMEVIIIVYATSVCVGPNYSILVSSIFIQQSIAKQSESTSSIALLFSHIHFSAALARFIQQE